MPIFKIRAEQTNEYDWKADGVIVTPGTLLIQRKTNSWGEDTDKMEFIDFIPDPINPPIEPEYL